MKKIYRITKIAEWIAKSISRQIGPEERERLNSWKNESENNNELFNRINNWDNFQERNLAYKNFDAEKAWTRFDTKINKPTARIRLNSILKYAAVIMLPLLFGGILFYYLSDTDNTTEQVAQINPGSQSAIIILDNGKSINLEEGQLNQLVEKDGSVIQNKKGEVSYANIKRKRTREQLKNTLVVPRGGEYNLVLSDGTKVYLNSVSKLHYPVTFNGKKREVSLEGEAYFEVERDENRPFFVIINGMRVEVLGTSFNIKAYTDDDKIFTTLVEGSVKVNNGQGNEEWVLAPNEQAILKKEDNSVSIHQVDARQFIGWKNGVYSFTNQSIGEIMKTLSRWYDFEYDFASEELKKITFEGGLNKYDDIHPILDIIQSTGKIKYQIDGKKIIFMQE